jgi:hypothetical protein
MWSRGHTRTRKIWIGDALGGEARCRLSALRQRGIAACDVAPIDVVDLHADRIVRIIRLARTGAAVKTVPIVKIANPGTRIRASFRIDAAWHAVRPDFDRDSGNDTRLRTVALPSGHVPLARRLPTPPKSE